MMSDDARRVRELDPDGFNELRMCRDGPMLYNKHDTYIGLSLRKYGEFSQAEQELFAQLVRPGSLVVEAGANIGAHTVHLSRLVGRAGAVYAFEPQRIVYQTLCANLALNQCINVFASQMALGARTGSTLVPASDPSMRNNFGGVSLTDVSVGEPVPLVTIDGLDLPVCHLLKVDVEGMECEVLEGAGQTIDMYRPLLYVENDREDRSEQLLTLVRDLRYVAYWHIAYLFNPANFSADAEDVFAGIAATNLLCIPEEAGAAVTSLRAVTSPQDTWGLPKGRR